MRIEVNFSPALLEALDQFIAQQSVVIGRAEAIELIVRDWLVHNGNQPLAAIGKGGRSWPQASE